MIAQLLWKEYRTQKAVLILGITFLVGPFLVYFGGTSSGFADSMSSGSYVIAMVASIVLSQITLLVLGGSIIATERQNRSLEFQLLLPPTRSHLLIAKTLFCLAVMAVIWLCLLVMAEIILPFCVPENQAEQFSRVVRYTYQFSCPFGLAMFGIAWMGSAVFENIAIPTVLGLAIVIAVVTIASRIPQWIGLSDSIVQEYFGKALALVYLIIAIATYIGGWKLFTRRW